MNKGAVFAFGAIAFIAALIATLLTIGKVYGHDYNRPDLDGWYTGLHAKGGAWCCNGSEATRLADVDWESRDGHYRVRLEGEWVDVPDDAVIEDPNRDGRTLVWPTWQDGHPAVRCFLPAAMI